jgi:hypothetical protein
MTSAKEITHRLLGARPKSLANILAAFVLGSVVLAPAARANDDDERVRTEGNISYVSGGVGTESLDTLRSLSRDFNLKLVFALKSGEFVSSVRVTVADAKGKSLLDTTSEGPWLLARLPTGSYQIGATFGDNAITRKIAVETAKLKVLDFRWASE